MKSALVIAFLLLTACSPAKPTDPRAAAGTWPPKDYAEFIARPPMSVGAELDDEWTMAIEAERWSYQLGVAIVAIGETPPRESGTTPSNHIERTARGLRNAATRFAALQALTCKAPLIAKAEDCSTFAPPTWFPTPDAATPPKEELQDRLQWFESHAYKFVQPACTVAIKRTGDERYCVAE